MNPDKDCYSEFVIGLARTAGAERILEIGLGCEAKTAEGILKYTRANFVSIENAVSEYALFLQKEFNERFCIINGDSGADSTYETLSGGRNKFDLVLIDGAHDDESVLRDIGRVIKHNVLATDGYFVFHDCDHSPVRYALQVSAKNFNLDIFFLANLNVAIGKFRV